MYYAQLRQSNPSARAACRNVDIPPPAAFYRRSSPDTPTLIIAVSSTGRGRGRIRRVVGPLPRPSRTLPPRTIDPAQDASTVTVRRRRCALSWSRTTCRPLASDTLRSTAEPVLASSVRPAPQQLSKSAWRRARRRAAIRWRSRPLLFRADPRRARTSIAPRCDERDRGVAFSEPSPARSWSSAHPWLNGWARIHHPRAWRRAVTAIALGDGACYFLSRDQAARSAGGRPARRAAERAAPGHGRSASICRRRTERAGAGAVLVAAVVKAYRCDPDRQADRSRDAGQPDARTQRSSRSIALLASALLAKGPRPGVQARLRLHYGDSALEASRRLPRSSPRLLDKGGA